MIEFITDAGVSLDLSPDAEFQIDFESPIFADDRMPVAFSTQVSFPPTQRNLAAFGMLPGTLNLPSRSAIRVVMHAGGIPLFPGLLVFDGIEDGMIQYSFSGTDVAESFEELDIADFAPLASVAISAMTDIQDGKYLFVKAPLLIDKEYVATPIYDSEDGFVDGCGAAAKYSNLYASEETRFTPAFPLHQFVLELFLKNGMEVAVDGSLADTLTAAHILGQYRPKASDGNYGILADASSMMLISHTLPEMSAAEFLANIMKMLCCALFRDGSGFALMPLSAIFDSGTIINLDHAVADSPDLSVEPASSYRFGFADEGDNSYSSEQLESDIAAGNVTECDTFREVCTTESEEYTAYFHKPTGYVYSSRKMACGIRTDQEGTTSYTEYPQRLTDILYSPHESVSYKGDAASDSESDASVAFHLVRCIPENVYTATRNTKMNADRIAPVMAFEEIGNERGNEAYVGLIVNNQMCDSGIAMNLEDGSDYDSGLSLKPQRLFDLWHSSYARWLGKERASVTVGLNLSLLELASLRLYQKVYFRGKVWIIKKLSLSLAARTDSIRTECEFVSL